MLKRFEHWIKAAVFGLCKIFLKRGRTLDGPIDTAQVKRVLFLRPEKIGDMVISLPIFDALKEKYPHISISILASPRSLSLVKDDPRFDKVFIYRKRLIRDIRELLAIRRENYDIVLDMIDDDSVTTLFYSQLASSQGVRIGIGKNHHADFYDYNHNHADGVGGHIVDNTMKLLAPFGINAPALRPSPPYVSEAATEKVERWLTATAPAGLPLIGINLSAGRPNRIWPPERSQALCDILLEEIDLRLIIIVAPNDRPRGMELIRHLSDRSILVPPGLGLLDVSALISHLDLLISPDTSLIHIARSFNIPVVGLYSRATKNFQRWRPYQQADGAVVGKHHDNIYDITVEQVFERCRQVRMRVEAKKS